MRRSASSSMLLGREPVVSPEKHVHYMRACNTCGALHECVNTAIIPEIPLPEPLPPLKKWRKILYERQAQPDNYVDESFLNSMVTNANLQPLDLKQLFIDTLVISQQFSIVALFLLVFHYFSTGTLGVRLLITCDAVLIFMGFGIRVLLEDDDIGIDKLHSLADHLTNNIKRFFLFVTILLGFSPVLRTLTSAYSLDSIQALTFVFLSIHLISHDYSFVNAAKVTSNFSGTVSLNASIFSSVLLASRLSSSLHVFALILFSFEVFAGFPVVSRSVKHHSNTSHIIFNLFIILVTLGGLFHLSSTLGIIYIGSLLFINVISPFWLKRIQRYKKYALQPIYTVY